MTLDPSKPRLAQIEGTAGWAGAFPGRVTLGSQKYGPNGARPEQRTGRISHQSAAAIDGHVGNLSALL